MDYCRVKEPVSQRHKHKKDGQSDEDVYSAGKEYLNVSAFSSSYKQAEGKTHKNINTFCHQTNELKSAQVTAGPVNHFQQFTQSGEHQATRLFGELFQVKLAIESWLF